MKTELRQRARAAKNTLFALLLLACAAQPALGLGAELPPAVDLRSEAEQAVRKGGPLIILFSRQDCRYCETVKRDYLKPLANDPRHRDRVLVRQINQDSSAALIDFRGEPSTHTRFADSEKIKLFPVVAFYGRDGKRLAAPIVGTRLPDFYQSYLDDAIEQSISALRGR
ncbi:MAG: thioredoxin family protein [Dechloromonas sp.]|nr:thioredoxin family protein [Dechloromonas sp.]